MEDAVFNDWRLVALSPLPSWMLVLAAVALVSAVWLAGRALKSETHAARRWTLITLRVLAAASALALLAEPGVERLATKKRPAVVAVMVDGSRSMSLASAPNGPTRAEVAVLAVKDALKEFEGRFQVEFYTFAENAAATDAAALSSKAPGPFAGERTQLLPSLEEVVRSAGSRPLAGVVVASDGADNGALEAALAEGGDAAKDEATKRLAGLKVPVFALDPTGGDLADLSVAAVRVDDFAFVRSTVEVEVELRQQGLGEGLSVPVQLEREGQLVARADATVSDGKPAAVKLSFAPDTTGEYAYTVRVPAQSGEAVTANNSRSFVLKVIRDRVRVLHVAGRPSWDERFLRQLLKRDPNVDLISFFILRTPSDLTMTASNDELSLIPFPTDEIFRQQLKTFDLVIFHDFTFKPYHMAQYLPGIADYVRGGGSFLMVGGDQSFAEGGYGGTPIADVLPVELAANAGAPTTEPFQPRLTADGRRHPVTELAPGETANEAAWKALPALHGVQRATLKAGAQLLLEHPTVSGIDGRPAPVAVVMDVGRGRSMAVMADSTWLWALDAAREGKPPRGFETLYHNAIRWLVRDPELTQVRVQAERDRFAPRDEVAFVVKARTRDYGPAAGAHVQLELSPLSGSGPSRALEGVVASDGSLRLTSAPLAAGPWRAVATVRRDGEELGRGEDVFVVEDAGPEFARPFPRPDILSFVAAGTGGGVERARSGVLKSLALEDPGRVDIGQRKSRPLWDGAWALGLFALLVGAEWTLRRRWGYA
ncbi:MAG: hypothetical protein RL199_204 [Pseudomonadota bacterium]